MSDRTIRCRLHLRHTDFVMRNHRVHGVSVLPGVTFLDIVFRVLAAQGVDRTTAVLRDVLFTEVVATAEGLDREIRLTVAPEADGAREVVGESRALRDGVPVTGWARNFSARLTTTDEPEPVLDAEESKRSATARGDMAELYARAREERIEHGPPMRCRGTLHRGVHRGAGLLADIELEQDEAGLLDRFHLHPGVLDAASLVAFAQRPSPGEPFIPVFIESFRAPRPLRGRVYVSVPRAEEYAPSGDLVHSDCAIHDETGALVAEFRRLSCKRIRHSGLVTRLLDVDGVDGVRRGVAVEGPAETGEAEETPERGQAPCGATDGAGPAEDGAGSPGNGADPVDAWRGFLRKVVGETLRRDPDDVATATGFYELGLDSVTLLDISGMLEEAVGTALYPTLLFEFGDIDSLARHLASAYGPPAPDRAPATPDETVTTAAEAGDDVTTVCLRPVWAALPAPGHAGPVMAAGDLVVLGGSAGLAENLRGRLTGSRRVLHRAMPGDREDLRGLLRDLRAEATPRTFVVPAPADDDPASPYRAVQSLAAALVEERTSEPCAVLYVHAAPGGAARPQDTAVGALARTVTAETPVLRCLRVEVDADPADTDAVASALARLTGPDPAEPAPAGPSGPAAAPDELRCVPGSGWARRAYAPHTGGPDALPLRHGGTYVVAGGTGGIGLRLAEFLARERAAKLVLLGRSALPAGTDARFTEWEAHGAEVLHLRADITDEGELTAALAEARRRFGALTGVFHCAGTVRDAAYFRKDPGDAEAVLAAKITGTVRLDAATAGDDLDLFVLFSSLSAAVANPGQSDYAYANAWQEQFARLRAARADRPGRTLAVAWPYWAEGGMRVDARTLARTRSTTGLVPLPTGEALRVLTDAGTGPAVVTTVLHGDAGRVERLLPAADGGPRDEDASGPMPAHGPEALPAGPATARPGEDGRDGGPAKAPAPDDIAIVGVAGQYPRATDVNELWRNLVRGRDCITEIPPERWPHDTYYAPERGTPGRTYGRWGGFVDAYDRFDREFFGISRRDAERMDPQERLFLMTAWHTLEDAGHPPATLAGRAVGVFVGVMWNHYQLVDSADDGVAPMAAHSAVANRVSYTFDLRGPSMALDTACSSSLTALHLAVRSVRAGECEAALAGGVNLIVHPQKYLQLAQGRFLSDDGRCRAFGRGGTGYVPGEGVGAVLLKPLRQALLDGDHVYAVISGSAVNHTGRTSGFTVPSPAGQAQAVRAALRDAGVAPERIDYLEAHGTGTSLGDPIEVEGLRQALTGAGDHRCAIGSVKSTIGHLESAAGIAAVTKVLLQLHHRRLAPTLHADETNPHIDFERAPVRVQREAAVWPPRADGVPRTSGVSSFGAGGSNVHLVLTEGPARPEAPAAPPAEQLFVLSARDETALRAYAGRWVDHLNALTDTDTETDAPRPSLADLAYTSRTGRTAMAVRLAVVTGDLAGLRAALHRYATGKPPADGDFWTYAGIEPDPTGLDGLARTAAEWVAKGEPGLPDRADHWASRGLPTDTDGLRKVPLLPNYPFSLERHWPGEWAAGRHAEAGGTAEDRTTAGGETAAEAETEKRTEEEAPVVTGTNPSSGPAAHGAGPEDPAGDAQDEQARRPAVDRAVVRQAIVEALCAELRVAPDEIDLTEPFSDLGVDSIAAEVVRQEIGGRFGVELDSVTVYDHPTVERLTDHVLTLGPTHDTQVAAGSQTAPGDDAADGHAGRQPHGVTADGPESVRGAQGRAGAEPAEDAEARAGTEPSGPVRPARDTERAEQRRDAAAVTSASGAAAAGVPDPHRGTDIAVIGMAGRFPGAPTLDAYWENLLAGRCEITEIPAERWDAAQCYDPDPTVPGTTCSRWAALLDDVDAFDAAFFGVSPLEAEAMDPQQRLFLREAWNALEHAGYGAPRTAATGNCGVFVGSGAGDYGRLLADRGQRDSGYAFLGNAPSILAARIAYLLDLTGPTLAVDTACSSSLVAVHLACQSIRSGECDMALAGGVALMLTPELHVRCGQVGMLSPTGVCAPFAASADGTVLGEGVGAVVLKRLDRALADGDTVHGVIRADGVNGDGRTNGITAPSARSQTELIASVHRRSGLSFDDIGYVEAHGTGTPLGDPIEVKALTDAFHRGTDRTGYCGLGSVKANVGHTTMAAGIASLLKVLLALRHRTQPPAAGFGEPNPRLDLDGSPFRVRTEAVDWLPGPSGVRAAAVSGFGFSGTNCHLVVAEAPPAAPRPLRESQSTGAFTFPVSARTETELRRRLEDLATVAFSAPEGARGGASARDIAFTLAVGRRHLPVRAALTAGTVTALGAGIRRLLDGAPDAGAYWLTAPEDDTSTAAAYVRGADPDWESLFAGTGARRIPLPTYPFTESRYWAGAQAPSDTGSRTESADASGGAGADGRGRPGGSDDPLDAAWLLADHVVAGTPTLPATATPAAAVRA
uniref:SDR family NAD(P)-dependent oxidoreductase n=1 Tax=Streptomyces sp. JHA26 TaxID=1917143 RepID=UPI0015C563F8